jgi:phasin
MASEGMPAFNLPPEMRAFAEQSVAQAKKAFDGFMTAAQGAVSTMEGQAAAAQASAKDVQRKAVNFAEQNVAASFEFAQKLLAAKDPTEIMKLHSDYVKGQMQVFGEQTRELSRTSTKSSAELGKVAD